MMYYSQLLRCTDMKNKMPLPSAQVRRWCDGPGGRAQRVEEMEDIERKSPFLMAKSPF